MGLNIDEVFAKTRGDDEGKLVQQGTSGLVDLNKNVNDLLEQGDSLDASNLASGTVPDGRISESGVTQFPTAVQVGKIYAVDGAGNTTILDPDDYDGSLTGATQDEDAIQDAIDGLDPDTSWGGADKSGGGKVLLSDTLIGYDASVISFDASVLMQLEGVSGFHVESYGAKPDKECGPALQAAITQGEANNETLVGRSGATYLTTQALSTSAGAVMNFDMADVTIKQADNADIAEPVLSVTLSSASGKTSTKVRVDANEGNNTSAYTDGVTALLVSGIRKDPGRLAAWVKNADTGVIIEGNTENSNFTFYITGCENWGVLEQNDGNGNTPDENKIEIYARETDTVYYKRDPGITTRVDVFSEATGINGGPTVRLDNGTTDVRGIIRGAESDGIVQKNFSIADYDVRLIGTKNGNWAYIAEEATQISGSLKMDNWDNGSWIKISTERGSLQLSQSSITNTGLRLGDQSLGTRLNEFVIEPGSVIRGDVLDEFTGRVEVNCNHGISSITYGANGGSSIYPIYRLGVDMTGIPISSGGGLIVWTGPTTPGDISNPQGDMIILNNRFEQVSYYYDGSDWRDPRGIIEKDSGAESTSSSSSITVPHNLSSAPQATDITVVPTSGSDGIDFVQIESITSSDFTINFGSVPSGTIVVEWEAILR